MEGLEILLLLNPAKGHVSFQFPCWWIGESLLVKLIMLP